MKRTALVILLALSVGAAGCGSSSPQDVAKSNGEKVGKAVKELTSASSVADVQNGVSDLQSALKDVQKNVKDKGGRLKGEITTAQKTLTNAFNSVKQAASSGNISQLSSALGAFQVSLMNIGEDARSLASTTDDVAKAFWKGVQDGYNG